jgi:hypothetical protein
MLQFSALFICILTWGGSIDAGLFSTGNISITEHGEKIPLEEDPPS